MSAIGSDGEITWRCDLHGHPFEVVIAPDVWFVDTPEQAKAILTQAGRPIPETIRYPVRD